MAKVNALPNRKLLFAYTKAIRTMRDQKGMTFREIADWLCANGVGCNHNAVYRVYLTGLHPAEAEEEQEIVAAEEAPDVFDPTT